MISLIINCLDSHEIVRRQMLYLGRILPADWEFVLVDDGSDPPLEPDWTGAADFRLIRTQDYRPWTQPAARNRGVRESRGDWLLMLDIDHFLTPAIVRSQLTIRPAMRFPRVSAELTPDGNLRCGSRKLHAPPNIFILRRDHFERVGGYNERFCGRYGGDDKEFFGRLRKQGVSPKTSSDRMGVMVHGYGLLHNLSRR